MTNLTRAITRAITQPLTQSITSAPMGGGGTSNDLDLFVIVGQSNAVGIGTAAQSPAAPDGRYITGSTISALADPVGNANTGSAWPAFSNAWAAATGRKSAFVTQAVVGSSLVAAGTGWNPTGSLRAWAVSAANTAIAAIAASSFTPGNVYFIWLQGEQEALTYNGTTITEATHEQALEDLAAYFKAQVPSMVTMGVVNIAGPGSGANVTTHAAPHTNYQRIRKAIVRACNDSANLTMLYDGTYHFVGRGYLSDGTHYKQAAYNLTGTLAAQELAAPGTIVPPAISSPMIAATAYADPSINFGASRSASHVTASGTTFVIVALGCQFPDNAAASSPVVTFGGVTMRKAAFVESNGGTPAASAVSAIFYIDEATYGSSLAGVTATVNVSTPNYARLHDWVVFDCKDIGCADTEGGAYPSIPAGTDTAVTTVTTHYPAFLVTVGSSTAASASALTATLTNATEVMDHGLSTGTRSGQTVVGYSDQSAGAVTDYATTIQWSASCDHVTAITVAFRAKMPGEFD